MKTRLLKLVTVLLITFSAGSPAEGYRLDHARPGDGSRDNSQPGSHAEPGYRASPDAGPSVPGRSYRDQAPPRYRIEPGYGGGTNAFPRLPGTSYRDYSRPSYNSRQ